VARLRVLAQGTYSAGAVFGIRVQVAERPVPSARTLPSPFSCSRTSRIVWSLTPGTAVLISARRNVAGAWRRMCSRIRCCLVPGVLADAARSAKTGWYLADQRVQIGEAPQVNLTAIVINKPAWS